MLKIALAAIFFAAAPAAAFAGGAVPAKAASAAVEIRNMQFMPQTLTVTAGTTVTWTNDDSSPHTVTEKGRVFHSAALDTKDIFSYTFKTPGEFTYFCTIHPMMVGRIIVKPAGSVS
ncbi:MAG: cupredoxin domain-containing protein [Stellaceae bacterium]